MSSLPSVVPSSLWSARARARRAAWGGSLAATMLATSLARADAPADAGAAPSTSAGAAVEGPSCVEHLPPGATRPQLRDMFPGRGLSGHAVPLTVVVEHGRGETVLSQDVHVQAATDAAKALHDAGFALPHPDGGAGPTLSPTVEDAGARATTTVTVSFVALPPLPGRAHLVLPPVPITVARASGEVITVCTRPHEILIDDPIASTPDAKPMPNPPPRSQREEWTVAKYATYGGLAGIALAASIAWLASRWLRRPRPVPPPPPPRPPWEVAFEELHAIKRAGFVAAGRPEEHVDRVSDAVRRYLGSRYGFDGLESTTDEMTKTLRAVRPAVPDLPSILSLLADCDLVKFARLTPGTEDCARLLEAGEHIVHVTMPRGALATPSPPAAIAGGPPS